MCGAAASYRPLSAKLARHGLDGQGVQPHRRLGRRLLGPGGRLQALQDHAEAAVAVVAEPQVVGIREVDVQVGPALDGERLLEDRLGGLVQRVAVAVEPVPGDGARDGHRHQAAAGPPRSAG